MIRLQGQVCKQPQVLHGQVGGGGSPSVPSIEPVAYSYGILRLPKICEVESHPYMIICCDKVYAFTEPIKYEAMTKLYATAPYLYSELKEDENGKEYWTDFEVKPESEGLYITTTQGLWVNFDLLRASNDSVYMAKCSDPIPVYLPEILYFGNANIIVMENFGNEVSGVNFTNSLCVGDKVRVIVNGDSREYTVEQHPRENERIFGNRYLWDKAEPDDGFDIFIGSTSRSAYPYVAGYGVYGQYRNAIEKIHLVVERIALAE